MILQDLIQVSLAEHKSREEQEARENVALVYEHLAAEEIEKLVEDPENVDDSSPLGMMTHLFPALDKDNLMVDVTNIVPPVNIDDEEDEITDEVFELRRRVKGKNVEETRISPIPSPTRSPRNLSTIVSSDTENLQKLTVTHPTPSSSSSEPKFMPRTSSDQLADNLHDVMMETLPSLVKEKAHISSQIQNAIDNAIPSLVDTYVCSYMSGHILYVHLTQVQSSSVPEQQHQLYLAMKADPLLQKQDIAIWLALQMKFEKTQVPQTTCRSSAARTRDQDDPHDDAHPEGENSAKRHKTSEYEAYVSGESSFRQVNVEEPCPSTLGNQEQDDEFDFWTDSYASDDEMMRSN
ncbi:hypothetical protein Tco_0462792 [Tanacetum coccineum]